MDHLTCHRIDNLLADENVCEEFFLSFQFLISSLEFYESVMSTEFEDVIGGNRRNVLNVS